MNDKDLLEKFDPTFIKMIDYIIDKKLAEYKKITSSDYIRQKLGLAMNHSCSSIDEYHNRYEINYKDGGWQITTYNPISKTQKDEFYIKYCPFCGTELRII